MEVIHAAGRRLVPHGRFGTARRAHTCACDDESKLRLAHVGNGVLTLDSVGPEVMRLYPDGEVGRYRVAHPFCNGARAILEEGTDGVHLWYATFHARRTS